MKVLVTGSSKGIGRQVCVKFLAQGHEVLGGKSIPTLLLIFHAGNLCLI